MEKQSLQNGLIRKFVYNECQIVKQEFELKREWF